MPKKTDKDKLLDLGIGVGQDQFYLNLPYLALIDPDLWKGKNPWGFDIKTLLPDFYERMQGNLKFKILGKALLSATQLHYEKIIWLIARELKEKEKQEIDKKKKESKDLPPLKVPIRRYSEEISKEELMDQLIKVLLNDKKRTEKRLKQKEKTKEKQIRENTRKRRIPLMEAMGPKDFDYEVDADRMNVKEKNEQVYNMAIKLLKESEEEEIRFENLLRALADMANDPRILMARVLLAVLFLIADGLLYAEQDVETKQIFIMLPEKAKKLELE